MMATTATTAELQQGLRQRLLPENGEDMNSDLPYGGKVFLARRKKSDPTYVRVIEASVIIGTLAFAYYAYFYFDNLHFHVTNGYAHLGYAEAQHQTGQRYLLGKGTDKHHGKAMEWFKKASDQGHPHAIYNYAIGQLKGYHSDLAKGEAHNLIRQAASKGVKEAQHTLSTICTRGGCNN